MSSQRVFAALADLLLLAGCLVLVISSTLLYVPRQRTAQPASGAPAEGRPPVESGKPTARGKFAPAQPGSAAAARTAGVDPRKVQAHRPELAGK